MSAKTVGIFVTASLPWRLRITKVNFDLGGHSELRMTGHLGSTIPSQRFVEVLGKLARLLDEGGDDALCVLVFDLRQHHKAGMAFYQRGDEPPD